VREKQGLFAEIWRKRKEKRHSWKFLMESNRRKSLTVKFAKISIEPRMPLVMSYRAVMIVVCASQQSLFVLYLLLLLRVLRLPLRLCLSMSHLARRQWWRWLCDSRYVCTIYYCFLLLLRPAAPSLMAAVAMLIVMVMYVRACYFLSLSLLELSEALARFLLFLNMLFLHDNNDTRMHTIKTTCQS